MRVFTIGYGKDADATVLQSISEAASSRSYLAKDPKTLGTLNLPPQEQIDQYGTMFRPLETLKGMEAWTDDYSDVMRVMMIPELQKFRRFLGLPTLKDE